MKKYLLHFPLSFLIIFIFFHQQVWAVTFKVVDKKNQLIYQTEQTFDIKSYSVGQISEILLRAAQNSNVLRFEGNDSGVISINDQGNQLELISDEEMKAFGWCFSINGKTPETFAHETHLLSQSDQIVWFYAYAHYIRGNWVSQCVPSMDQN